MPALTSVRRGAAFGDRPNEALPARDGRAQRAPLHVCFVALHAWPVLSGDAAIGEVGGAEVQQSILARLLERQGYRVSMVCLDYGQAQKSVVHGITVHKAFRFAAGVPVLRFLHPRLTSVWRALHAADADIYYTRSVSPWVGFVAEFCRRHARRSVYAGASDMDFVPDLRGKLRFARDRWLYRRGLERVDAIVAQNEAQRETCLAHYRRHALVIPSCYEPPARRAAAAAHEVLWVGTMRAGKRPELFLELAKRLPRRRFVMVGGPERREATVYERVRRAAAALPNVELTGFLPLERVEERFDAARLLVNTSDYEGMPNTFLQAWARGVPTLGSVDVGTPVHLQFAGIDEGAREIERLLTDPQAWSAASRRCLEHYRRAHSGDVTLERYRRLFSGLSA
jgi:glycosyltransferase involved in cell wall biosynthesis